MFGAKNRKIQRQIKERQAAIKQDMANQMDRASENHPAVSAGVGLSGAPMVGETLGEDKAKASVPQRSPHAKGTAYALAQKRDEFSIKNIPEGVIIKRTFERPVKPGHVANKWRVTYWNRTPEYFGVTLDAALAEFFKNNDDIYQKYLISWKLNRGL